MTYESTEVVGNFYIEDDGTKKLAFKKTDGTFEVITLGESVPVGLSDDETLAGESTIEAPTERATKVHVATSSAAALLAANTHTDDQLTAQRQLDDAVDGSVTFDDSVAGVLRPVTAGGIVTHTHSLDAIALSAQDASPSAGPISLLSAPLALGPHTIAQTLIEFDLIGQVVNNTGGDATITIRLMRGGFSIIEFPMVLPTSAQVRRWRLDGSVWFVEFAGSRSYGGGRGVYSAPNLSTVAAEAVLLSSTGSTHDLTVAADWDVTVQFPSVSTLMSSTLYVGSVKESN